MSLYENINKRKKAGKSRPKSKSTISKTAYANMKKVFRTAKRIKVRARKMHEDKLKTPPANSTYRDNHQRIFGDPKGSEGIDEEVSRKLRLERHKNEVRLGKKDAQYYVDNEVRISADPNWQPKMEVSEAYKDGWNRIFNKP